MNKLNKHQLQTPICQYLDMKSIFYMAIPNQAINSKLHLAQCYRQEGLRASSPDLKICLENGKTLFLEVKVVKNKQPPTQLHVEQELCKRNHKYEATL
ncbi:hypothetical protein ABSA28_00915 [Candidatus Hepatincolaceae symbiont of Richtersius coronifer]